MTADTGEVRELALGRPAGPVLSVYVRTDPREPANTNHVPAWAVELRNGLRDVAGRLEAGASRDEWMAFRAMRERVEAELADLGPAGRARGVAWFLGAVDGLDRRLSLQIPPRETTVRWDERAFISPLVDVADRGRPTGLVLLAEDRVRLVQWEGGRVAEPPRSLLTLELGDWREYAAYAMANPARGQQTATHAEAFERRVAVWQDRFLREAAATTAQRVRDLGWRRLLLVGDPPLTAAFAGALPAVLAGRIAGRVALNLVSEEPAAIGERLEADLERAWREEADRAADGALQAARAGGLGAIGPHAVFDALASHRVEHLLLDPGLDIDPAVLPPAARAEVGPAAGALLVERAVELAVEGGATVTALPGGDRGGPLREAGGMAAALRF